MAENKKILLYRIDEQAMISITKPKLCVHWCILIW